MENNKDNQVKAFVSLFDEDISAAHVALDEYERRQSPSTAGIAQQNQSIGGEVISVQNVSKAYKLGKQTVHALRDVTLSIRRGEFVAITGASGSGKSTLLQLIGCLDKPTTGNVIIEGAITTKLSNNKLSDLRQKSIGFIFQSFYLQPFLSLDDNLAVPAMFTSEKKTEINGKVERLLRQVGLTDRAKHFPKELSGGQIQRAAIARALINNPHIILADEPTGNLDSTNSKAIIDLFRAIRDELGTTVIIVTHDAEIARQADRTIQLKDGAIA